MGGYLSQPITTKVTAHGENSDLAFGVASMQGWRTEMEDAHLCELELNAQTSIFGVFDGHGGKEVAAFAALHLGEEFLASKGFKSGNIPGALKECFLSLDQLIAEPCSQQELHRLSFPNTLNEEKASNEGDITTNEVFVPVALEDKEKMTEVQTKVSSFPIRLEKLILDSDSEEEQFDNSNSKVSTPRKVKTISSRILSIVFPFDCLQLSRLSRSKEKKMIKLIEQQQQQQQGNGSILMRAETIPFSVSNENASAVSQGTAKLMDTQTFPGITAAGSTAIVAVISKDGLYVANAGDSRCVICDEDKGVAMSRDHKPTDQEEFFRIRSGGGFVLEGRVNGCLNLSRAFGDLEYKTPRNASPEDYVITANPEVKCLRLRKGHKFLILACDGIWDVLSVQQACQFVNDRLKQNMELHLICSEMCDFCLAENSSGSGEGCDNMTVIIVLLKKYSSL